MTATPSRHDHFPRADAARRLAMRAAVASLDTAWAAADAAPGGLLAAIDSVADAPAGIAIARLLPWLADAKWLRDRLDAALALMAADPFARPPLRPVGGAEGGPGGLVLADRGAIRLTLRHWPFGASASAPATVHFVPGHAAIHVLASGGAHFCEHHVAVSAAEEAGCFTASTAAACHSAPPRPLQTGETLHLDTARQSFTLEDGGAGGGGDVLLLELTVQPPLRLPIRTYDVASGRLLHVSASRRDSSFRAMALALLRHLGRRDAAPLFIAETESSDFAARWNAMREFVALDPAAARAPLARMAASDPHPEVRRAAAATAALLAPSPSTGGMEAGGSGGPCASPASFAPNASGRPAEARCPA